MQNNGTRQHGGGSFSSGLMLGFILGAAFVFFIGTKKGRKLFKLLMEEGSEGVSEVRTLIDEMSEEELAPESAEEKVVQPVRTIATAKRFFKGIRRKQSVN